MTVTDATATPTTGRTGRYRRLRRLLRPFPLVIVAASVGAPFLGYANANQEQRFSAPTITLYAVGVFLVSMGAVAVLTALTRRADPDRLAVAVGVTVVSFFSYSRWLSILPPTTALLVANLGAWTLLTAVAARLAFVVGARSGFRQWLAATLVIICAVNLAGLTVLAGPMGSVDREAGTAAATSPEDLVRSPNVYYFLLDGYARNDVIAADLGGNNAAFHDELRARGFEVTEHSVASYPMTFLSMMTIFESGYPADEPADFEGKTIDFDRYVRGGNTAVERFDQLGYQFIHSHAGPFSFTRCTDTYADVCIPPDARNGGASDLEITLLGLTPLGPLDLLTAPRTDPEYVLDQLEAAEVDEPFFLFAHILSPHAPYYFDESCDRRAQLVSRAALDLEGNHAAYLNEIDCVNASLLRTIDRIERNDPDAVIVLNSDHGTEFQTPWDAPLAEWTTDQLRERFANQNALRLPAECQGDVLDDTPTVHTFEIVFACLEGREPDLVEVRSFLWRPNAPHTVEELDDEQLAAIQGSDEP